MRVCGVELKGNEAIICLLSLKEGLFDIPACRVRKLDIKDASDAESLRRFRFTFAKLMQDYQVERVVIRQRPHKGKFAGGAVGFKLEAAIQLIDELDVQLLTGAAIKETVNRNPLTVDFRETGLKQFQQPAFNSAYASLMADLHDLDLNNAG